ncbi:DUF1080 domain-containing protein [Marinimicrobium sp. ABcell2]|uniref:3-keto-disaccharide hydrolase n=1 Tax=Marinimicrobium sp. ABcell2 TaxID=3069751 RepID=UPI0027B5E3C1|nr:DUF1080 domain-containing protein [Marinimicrobium sp. ABcell2]MDQ2078222.1 DUF1080 domain-containing protein [Marinimicrobium sp. ABcell2]
MLISRAALLGSLALVAACGTTGASQNADEKAWIDLFNGQDLDDWSIKIRGSELGENTLNTFRVEDGLLRVSYDEYEEFNDRFGHIFYNEPFSHYILEVEYRFLDEQVKGGADWAYRNNGIMYHAQAPETMGLYQDFPTSVEYQILGGSAEGERSDANLCTPGTQIVKQGQLRTDHCIESGGPTHRGDGWVTLRLEVHGSEIARHIVDGEVVMEYTDLQLTDGTPLEGGYIALQAESHPTDFRSVRLVNLKGCMDEDASNYKSYLVKHDAAACRY